ncbi:hypothetical protein EBR96_04510 [bacterium]|nr:hypothetical protein [bacterium]
MHISRYLAILMMLTASAIKPITAQTTGQNNLPLPYGYSYSDDTKSEEEKSPPPFEPEKLDLSKGDYASPTYIYDKNGVGFKPRVNGSGFHDW